MKTFIVCGGDRLGKNSLISGIIKHYNYDNVCVRHLGKPPKIIPNGENALEYQAKCFEKEGYLLETLQQMEDDQYSYYENILIYNRFIYGEYVYGQMFRNQDPKTIENYIKNFEERYLLSNRETYFILLTADPKFFLEKEDGKSFSIDIHQKTTELKLFEEIFEKSSIENRLKIKVNIEDEFLGKDIILQKVLNLIKNTNG